MQPALKDDRSRIGGLPAAFIAGIAAQLLHRAASKSAMKLGVVALRRHTPEDLPARLDALFKAELPLSAAIYAGNDASLHAERWCIENSVAVRLVCEGATRFRADEAMDVIKRGSTVLLCAPIVRAEVAKLADQVKSSKRVLLDLTRASSDLDDDLLHQ